MTSRRFARRSVFGGNAAAGGRNRAVKCAAGRACEQLEQRVLMSTIQWTNKGSGAVDSDNFNATYGANSTIARNIVQRAIDDWERVIVDFNYAGGGNTFSVTFNAAPINGRGVTNGITANAAGKITSAAITLDDDAGLGWYFDPVIGTSAVPDDGEFVNLTSPFESSFNGVGGASDDDDMYRTAAHELGHAMGLFVNNGGIVAGVPAILGFLTDTNIDDPFDNTNPSTLVNFNVGGGPAEATFTENGGGHFWEGPPQGGGTLSHPNDLLNAGRTVGGPPTTRQLISDLDATILNLAYGYTIQLPSTLNTFYANLNTSTNVLTVTGDADPNGDDADVIDLEVSGTAMRFEVNGTAETIEGAQFTTIVVNAGADNDDIDVDALLSGKNVTVNGDAGNDSVDVALEAQDIDSFVLSNFTFVGGANSDTLRFHDGADGASADTYEFTSTVASKSTRDVSYSTVESLIINGSPQASSYNINSLSSSLTGGLTINAGDASDVISLGGTVGDIDSTIFTNVQVNGNGGTDTMFFNDSTDDASLDDSYTLTSFGFDKSSTSQVWGFTNVENVVLTAGLADNTINVLSMSTTLAPTLQTLLVNGNDGNDTIDLGSDLDSNFAFVNVTVNGQAGTDSLILDDGADDGADDYTLTNATFDKSTIGVALFTYGTFESLTLDMNDFINTIDVLSLNTPATINGGGGADTFNIATNDVDSNIADNMTINGSAGTDTMVFNDFADGVGQDDWRITSTAIVKNFVANRTFSYSGLEGILITASQQDNTYQIASTLATTPVTVQGGAGSDTFNVGSPANNTDNLDGSVTLHGNGGVDAVNYNDQANAVATTYTVSNIAVARSGAATAFFSTSESVVLNAGSAGDTINNTIVGANTPVTVNGNGGDDSFHASSLGDWDAFISNDLTIDGGAGTDSVRINDTVDAGADSYNISTGSTTKSSIASTISYTTIEALTLDANDDANTVTVTGTFNGDVRVNGRGGIDTIDVVGNFFGTFVTVDGGAALDRVRVNSDAAGNAGVQFVNTQDLQSLDLFTGGTARMTVGGSKLLFTQTLTIAATGRLDLNDNDMILDYAGASQLAVIQAQLNLGRAGGAWTGFGITSGSARANALHNTTLGAMEATQYDSIYGAGALFNAVDPDNTAVLVKYTYYGDADFNGQVNFDDYSRTDAGFINNRSGWINGDYDGNGNVNFDDYALMDLAFNTQTGIL